MAGFKFDYKPFDYGDFYGAGGGSGGGGGGGGGQGGGGGKGGGGRGNNNQGGGNYRQGTGRGDNMNWQNGRNDGVNRFRGGGGQGGGVKRDDLLPDKTGAGRPRFMSNMIGGGEARDMFGMRRNMPETMEGSGTGNLRGDMQGGGSTVQDVGGNVKGDGLNANGLARGNRFGFGEYKPREGFTDGQNSLLQNIAGSGIEGVHNFGPMANKMARKAEMWAGRGHDVFGGLMGGGSSFGADGTYTGGGGDGGVSGLANGDGGGAGYGAFSGSGAQPDFGRGITNSADYRASAEADRAAAELAHKQNLFAQNKGNAYATDFDYSQLAGMKPRDAYRSMQPPPPPRMPRQPR
jgi:hypothetical protein